MTVSTEVALLLHRMELSRFDLDEQKRVATSGTDGPPVPVMVGTLHEHRVCMLVEDNSGQRHEGCQATKVLRDGLFWHAALTRSSHLLVDSALA